MTFLKITTPEVKKILKHFKDCLPIAKTENDRCSISTPPIHFHGILREQLYLSYTIVPFNPTVISRIERNGEESFGGSLHKKETGVVPYSLIIFPQYIWPKL